MAQETKLVSGGEFEIIKCVEIGRNKIKLKSPNNVTRITPELQHIMQKFQQEKKPSNWKVLTSLDDANTFGSPVK